MRQRTLSVALRGLQNHRPALAVTLLTVSLSLSAGCQQGSPSLPNKTNLPVVYFQRPDTRAWQAIDWNGGLHGSIGSGHVGIPYQSPDGSHLIWMTEGVWQIVDNNGNVLLRPDLAMQKTMAWADDSSGLCVIESITATAGGSGMYRLVFVSVSGVSRTIAEFGTTSGPNVVACSPEAQRVVIATASGNRTITTFGISFGELKVIDFTGGAIEFDRSFPTSPPGQVTAVAASHDGLYAAITDDLQTAIIKLPSGQVVGHLRALTPMAFSWDGTRLAAIDTHGRGQTLEMPAGQVTWSDPTLNGTTQFAIPDPKGPDLMVLQTTGGFDNLLVISASGVSRMVTSGVFPDQLGPCSNCSAF